MPQDRKTLAGIEQTGDRRAKVPLVRIEECLHKKSKLYSKNWYGTLLINRGDAVLVVYDIKNKTENENFIKSHIGQEN